MFFVVLPGVEPDGVRLQSPPVARPFDQRRLNHAHQTGLAGAPRTKDTDKRTDTNLALVSNPGPES